MSQKTITVGTSGSPASLDTNFGNAQDNFTEIYAKNAAQDADNAQYREGTIITVSPDGTKDFLNLSAAVASIANPSANNKYTIYIYPGDYDVFGTLTAGELAGIGILLPNYTDLKGIGSREDIILRGELPNDTTLDLSTRLSTLNVRYNNNLYNLTVTAKNCRYPVHADNSNTFKNYIQHAEDCHFEHLGFAEGLWYACWAWGEGTASGAKIYFKNCVFKGIGAFSTHNNLNFEKGDYHEFENCDFHGFSDTTAARFQTLNSGKVSRVVFKGCRFKGTITQSQVDGSVTGLEYEINGHGNNITVHITTSTQNIQKYINFIEEVDVKKTNNFGTAFARGVPMKLVGYDKVGSLLGTDTTEVFAGLVLIDVSTTDTMVVLKKAGYFPVAYTTLSGLSVGDLIGIVSGALAVVASRADAFAVAVDATYLKFL